MMNDAQNYVFKILLKVESAANWGGYVAAMLGWALSFILPIKDFLILTTSLVILDLLTGLVAANRRKEKVVSRGLMRTPAKLLLYYSAILAAEGVQVVFVHMLPVTYVAAFTIALTELKSIMENVDSGTGTGLVKAVVDKLSALLKKKSL